MAKAATEAIYFPMTTDTGESYHLVGIYYLAATDDPAPLALFLHGVPGSEKNHDLAHKLRESGWHVLLLHFSGAWGSGGAYDIGTHVRDARAALDYALSADAPRPIDPAKIAVMGYSMGSRAAIMLTHADERVGALISLSGFADFSEVMIDASFFETVAPLLAESTPQKIAKQFSALGNGLQPMEAIADIAPRPVLVVQGTADDVVQSYNATALANGDHVKLAMIDGANHEFGEHRAALLESIHAFLSDWIA